MSLPEPPLLRVLVDWKRLRSILGCGKPQELEKLMAAERAAFMGGRPDEIAPVLEPAIMAGVPLAGLEHETSDHEAAATRLAYSCAVGGPGSTAMLPVRHWSSVVHDAERTATGADERALLAYLHSGRALFGTTPAGFGRIYAFLEPEEAKALNAAVGARSGEELKKVLEACTLHRAGLFVSLPFKLVDKAR